MNIFGAITILVVVFGAFTGALLSALFLQHHALSLRWLFISIAGVLSGYCSFKAYSWLLRTLDEHGQKQLRLNPVEAQIIEAVAAALPEKAGGLLRSQVALVNKVQRLDQDREVDFYHMEKGKPTFPDAVLFPNRAAEFELARVHITDKDTGHQTQAALFMVKGRLFCIEFSHTPRDLRGASDLRIVIEHLGNPM